ncbi:hypothetical protein MKX03_026465 [Papaver bracteatum]|nr:hypothetical protein MKX03_026465 [Papaver bracteatum]
MLHIWKRKPTKFPLIFVIFSVCILILILYNEIKTHSVYVNKPASTDEFTTCTSTRSYSGGRKTRKVIGLANPFAEIGGGSSSDSCDLFSEKCVFDNTSYPLYNESKCPYMSDQLACQRHGRSNFMYQNWRSQPHNCNLKRSDNRIIRPDTILKHAAEWDKADILIFNAYLWWRQGPVKMLSREWGPGTEGNCYQQRTPINMEAYCGSGSDFPTMRMVDIILSRLGSKVSVLNITQLSDYRKDGHPSVFSKFW